jgi:toxin ParE1/3/4
MKAFFLEAAREELDAAIREYENKRKGLGKEFAREVRKSVRRIREFPGAWTRLDDEHRRCRTDRFPYGVVYRVEDGMILIVALMHLKRDPDYWKDRS